MVMALLSDQFLPQSEPIDLFNVAFANPETDDRIVQGPQAPSSPSPPGEEPGPSFSPHPKKKKGKLKEENKSPPFVVPDRVTGRDGLSELR